MANESFKPEIPFKTPKEELDYLREVVKQNDLKMESAEKVSTRELIEENISDYKNVSSEEILSPDLKLEEKEVGEIVLKLTPEKHDQKMNELLGILQEKGIKNSLSVVQKLNSPHLEDDFHRFLIQYLKSGYSIDGLKEKSALWKSLKMTLFQIALPSEKVSEKEKNAPLKELISSMEQFFSGMMSISEKSSENSYFTLEIAVSVNSDDIIMYCAIPDNKKVLFEKQVHSIFSGIQIREETDDYNVFVENGVSIASSGYLKGKAVYPLKTYEQYDYDPLNIVLSAFSKIEKSDGGAALQIVFKPKGDFYNKKINSALEKLKKGTPTPEAIDISYSFTDDIAKGFRNLITSSSRKKDDKTEKTIDNQAIEYLQEKVKSPIIATNLRLIASAKNKERAETILGEMESSFNQFENSPVNKITFNRYRRWKLTNLLRDFSFRRFSDSDVMPLNLKEITSMIHFSSGIASSYQLKQSRAKEASAPVSMPQEGTLLGVNISRGAETNIYLTKEDRLKHFYIIGQTGTGKTNLLKNMIIQDIKNGEGVCYIDPHGEDIQDILSKIPEERWEDVIYFDPGFTERVMALNMLEYDPAFPEQKTFVINELVSIFEKLYDLKATGGPMFEQYFRNAAGLVLEDPESGNTLLDISRVLSDSSYREAKLSKSKNPVINQFWREIASKTTGESGLGNIVPYITGKFDVFLSNEIMRPIIAQQKSTLNFRKIMDEKKILLVNLSKGRLGDINSHLIGLILVGKILMSTLSRADSTTEQNPFYLYIDEFQNITTDSISTILSEARKYKLSLNVAHQFITQLEPKIKDAVFGNVGSIVSFRVGPEDAEFLEKQFTPTFNANDLINIDNFNGYARILANGSPVKPFNIKVLPPTKGNPENIEKIKQLSYLKYGRPREEVEEEVSDRYKPML
jgi:type IV secretory pathway TraG/TraD family ATPase VirD4